MKKLEILLINLKGLELTFWLLRHWLWLIQWCNEIFEIFARTQNISNKSIIEHQKDSLRKVKREMCLTDEKLNILTEGNIITWFITLFIMWSTVNVKTINYMKTINVDWTSLKIYFNLI